jgi:hypothetical protein
VFLQEQYAVHWYRPIFIHNNAWADRWLQYVKREDPDAMAYFNYLAKKWNVFTKNGVVDADWVVSVFNQCPELPHFQGCVYLNDTYYFLNQRNIDRNPTGVWNCLYFVLTDRSCTLTLKKVQPTLEL